MLRLLEKLMLTAQAVASGSVADYYWNHCLDQGWKTEEWNAHAAQLSAQIGINVVFRVVLWLVNYLFESKKVTQVKWEIIVKIVVAVLGFALTVWLEHWEKDGPAYLFLLLDN